MTVGAGAHVDNLDKIKDGDDDTTAQVVQDDSDLHFCEKDEQCYSQAANPDPLVFCTCYENVCSCVYGGSEKLIWNKIKTSLPNFWRIWIQLKNFTRYVTKLRA